MDWSQILFVAVLAAALIIGRAPPLLWLVMPANLVLTMDLAGNPLAVGCVDAASAAALCFAYVRIQIVAALFVAMLPIYPLSVEFGWSRATTYGIVDVLAYLQCGVIGRGDRGIAYCLRNARGWRNRVGRAIFAWVQVARGVAQVSEKDVRG